MRIQLHGRGQRLQPARRQEPDHDRDDARQVGVAGADAGTDQVRDDELDGRRGLRVVLELAVERQHVVHLPAQEILVLPEELRIGKILVMDGIAGVGELPQALGMQSGFCSHSGTIVLHAA